MGKSKSGSIAKLPKEQRCQFLIGPNSSWYVPNISDIWTQPSERKTKQVSESNTNEVSDNGDIMDCDLQPSVNEEKNDNLSYFLYGCIGCFCYGEIYHHKYQSQDDHSNSKFAAVKKDPVSAFATRLIDVKEDNSRVSCVRFLKTSMFPIAMVLTENGSLVIHDCLSSTNLIHFKKSELINKFVEPLLEKTKDDTDGDEQQHCNKKARVNYTQQVNSCSWPDATNVFIAFSLVKQKTNLLFWLRVKDLTKMRDDPQSICKTDLIQSYQQLDLKLDHYSSPICCMSSALLDSKTCIVAIATDDGLITVVNVNFEQGQTKRVIKLARHNDQICSMSLHTKNSQKFPKGLLASASRSGLVLVWDIENEFYFADYQATSFGGKAGPRINWFCLSFLDFKDSKKVNLVISNCESGLTIFEVPENARSKIRLKENKDCSKKHHGHEHSLQHRALLFNVTFDPITNIIMTSSLDANHIVWKCTKQPLSQDGKGGKWKDNTLINAVPYYLLPSMPNNSKTHLIRHNPIREDLLGIAIGNAGVKFYRVTENLMNCRFDMSSSCNSIARDLTKAKLNATSLSWHPSHEYRLAIGTSDGKVFRADITPRKGTMIEAQRKKVVKSKLSTDKLNQKSKVADLFDVEYQPLDRNQDSDVDCNLSNTETSDSSNHYRNDGIYSLCWGPNPSCPQDISKLAIYAVGCATNRLSIYYSKKENLDKLTNYLDEFLDQSLPEAIGEASEVAWKPSMDLMALGTTTGKIIIVSYLNNSSGNESPGSVDKLFKKLAVIQGPLGGTYIQCLAWHSTTDKNDSNYYCIAASANESAAFVFDIRENILAADVRDRLRIDDDKQGGGEMDENDVRRDKVFSCSSLSEAMTNTLSNFKYKLGAHSKAVTDIIWNPHNPNELATSSFDRCAYVWSLTNSPSPDARIVSKFSARDRLFTLEWSLVDKDLIFTSGNDSTIWAWRPSENQTSRVNDITKSDVTGSTPV